MQLTLFTHQVSHGSQSGSRPKSARGSALRSRGARGAALVEAAIVISMLTLGLSGLIFFREYYVKELTVSRLTRAATIAYALEGCPDKSTPGTWLARDKLAYRVNDGAQTKETATDNKSNQSYSASGGGPEDKKRGNDLLSGIPGLGGDGKSILNPITAVEISGAVRTVEKGGVLRPERTLFNAELQARSFVTCGEEMREGSVMSVFDRAKNALGNLIKL